MKITWKIYESFNTEPKTVEVDSFSAIKGSNWTTVTGIIEPVFSKDERTSITDKFRTANIELYLNESFEDDETREMFRKIFDAAKTDNHSLSYR